MNNMLTRKNRRSKRRKGGGQYYGMEAPIVLELPVEDPIIVFSEELKRQLMEKLAKKKEIIGWMRKYVVAKSPLITSSDLIVNKGLSSILPLISKLLADNGLEVKDPLVSSDISVEIEYANAKEHLVDTDFVIHKDDFIDRRGIVRPVFTLIVCLDMDCDGGEIGFYSLNKKLIDKIKVRETPERKKIVMFNGGLYNKAEPIKNGKRVIVSYRIKQVEPSKYEEYHIHYPYTK
jgi:hypothetical protein